MFFSSAAVMLLLSTVGIAAGPLGAEESCTLSVDFGDARLLNNGIDDAAGPFAAELAAGTYTITVVSEDFHSTQVGVGTQPAEQFHILTDSGYRSPATNDIADDSDTVTTVFTGQAIDDTTSISLVHALIGDSVNSVSPISACFEAEIETEVAGIVEEAVVCDTDDAATADDGDAAAGDAAADDGADAAAADEAVVCDTDDAPADDAVVCDTDDAATADDGDAAAGDAAADDGADAAAADEAVVCDTDDAADEEVAAAPASPDDEAAVEGDPAVVDGQPAADPEADDAAAAGDEETIEVEVEGAVEVADDPGADDAAADDGAAADPAASSAAADDAAADDAAPADDAAAAGEDADAVEEVIDTEVLGSVETPVDAQVDSSEAVESGEILAITGPSEVWKLLTMMAIVMMTMGGLVLRWGRLI